MSGTVNAKELEAGLTSMGVSLSKGEIDALIKKGDPSGGGEINYYQFTQSLNESSLGYTPPSYIQTPVTSPKSMCSHGSGRSRERDSAFSSSIELTKEERQDKLIVQKIADRIQSFKGEWPTVWISYISARNNNKSSQVLLEKFFCQWMLTTTSN
jgi:hypothetical protein